MIMRMMLHFYIIPAGSIQSFDLQWKDTQPWQFRGCTDSQNVCQFSVLCNWVQFSVANCFWSIMRTCLRDMLIVVFFLGTVLYVFIYFCCLRVWCERQCELIKFCALHRMQRTAHCTSVIKLFFSLHRRDCDSELWI